MHRFKNQRGVLGLSIVLLLAALAGCKRNDPRLQRSIDALRWGGGSDNDRRIRDLLVSSLENATSESLATPALVAATAILPSKNGKKGTIHVDWIGASPAADGVRIVLSNGFGYIHVCSTHNHADEIGELSSPTFTALV